MGEVDQVFNELKNVGKINYQALEELRTLKSLMERCASSMENIAASNDNIARLMAQAIELEAAAANNPHARNS